MTKISSRNTTSTLQQDRIAEVLANYTTSPELELQQRAVEFASLFSLGDLREGVLERMPPPELKATVMGVGELVLASKITCVSCSDPGPDRQSAKINLLVQRNPGKTSVIIPFAKPRAV